MKRTWFIAVTIGIAVLTGCGKASGNGEEAAGSEAVQAAEAEDSDTIDREVEQPAKKEENNPADYPLCVMVDGIVYQDTGFHSSMIGCGTMDGKITSAVDAQNFHPRIISQISAQVMITKGALKIKSLL